MPEEIEITYDAPNLPRRTIAVGRLHHARRYFAHVPEWFDEVEVTLRCPDQSGRYFRAGCILEPSRRWRLTISPGMLPIAGDTTYEVRGVVDKGDAREYHYLGTGKLRVLDIPESSAPVEPGQMTHRATICDPDGAEHELKAIWDPVQQTWVIDVAGDAPAQNQGGQE